MKKPHAFPDAYAKAVRNANIDELVSLYADDVRFFDIWDQYGQIGIDAVRAMAREWFASLGRDHVVVTFSEVSVVESAELALLTSFVRFAAHDENGDRLRFLDERMTVGLRREAAQWKVIHQHSSAPIDSQDLGAKLERFET